MKTKILCLLILVSILSFGFAKTDGIPQCYISFSTADSLTQAPPEKLPADADKFRVVKTDTGDVTITRIDGYRVLYLNNKDVPFVNMKVELSESGSYKTDQQKVLENLKYVISHSVNMESRDIIQSTMNGYTIYGLSRNTIESGSTLGIFIMFPGNGVTVYFYFNNLKPEVRNFESVGDYKKLRDKFMDEYTKYLAACKNDAFVQSDTCIYKKYTNTDGTMDQEGCEVAGKKQGIWKEYTNNFVRFEWTYKDDVKDGPYKALFRDGKINAIGKYLNGDLADTIKIYAENGKLMCREVWKPMGDGSSTMLSEKLYNGAKPDGTMEKINGHNYMWQSGEKMEVETTQLIDTKP